MTTSNAELRLIAESALNPIGNTMMRFKSSEAFRQAANPAKVVAMLDQIDALTKDKQTLADALEKIIAKCDKRVGGKP